MFELGDSRALYLAIDQGGQGSRALVFNNRGEGLAEGANKLGVVQPHANWVEQDADDLVRSVRAAVDEATSALGERSRDITAAGLATQRSSIACWNKHTGVALSPVISWQDRRAYEWLEQFSGLKERIHKTTGLFLSAHYGASKFRWCLDNLPAVREAYENESLAWGPVASFLLFRLLAERPLLTDPANASRTLLWSLKTRDWDPELLALFGLPSEPLPRCVPSRHDFGTLRIADRSVPLSVVTGDQTAALFGFGQPQPETAYINIGTGAFVQRLSGRYPGYVPQFLTVIVLQDGDDVTYALEGTVNGAASALRWLEHEHRVGGLDMHLPEWLEQEVVPPLFLNGISGLGSPYWIADFRSRFVGEGQDAEKAVAVIESIAFLLQTNLEGMLQLASPPQQIQISGGLSRLDGLCQRLADISRLPIYRPREAEATARGVAFLLAGRPRSWPETELGEWFRPAHNPSLMTRYRAWREHMNIAAAQPRA